jgi:2'-5' RNA ligase
LGAHMGEKIRSFIAISLPDSVLHAIGKAQETLERFGFDIRWVRKERIHLTLKFLGDIEESDVERVGSAVKRAAVGTLPFTLRGAGIGVFPDLKRPRVVWTGLSGETQPLFDLQKKLEAELAQIGFPEERRPFKGHLTLGRVKGRLDRLRFGDALKKVEGFETEPFQATSVILFQSTLRSDGAVYTRLVDVRFDK